jgi:hypothetical protein
MKLQIVTGKGRPHMALRLWYRISHWALCIDHRSFERPMANSESLGLPLNLAVEMKLPRFGCLPTSMGYIFWGGNPE